MSDDPEAIIREFLEATEDYPDSEYNTFLINARAMRELCEEYRGLRDRLAACEHELRLRDMRIRYMFDNHRDLFEYAVDIEQLQARDYNRGEFVDREEAGKRVRQEMADRKERRRLARESLATDDGDG